MSAPGVPWTAGASGVVVSIRLTPKSSRDGFDGVEIRADGKAVLKARVRAAPQDGEANAVLIRLLANSLGVSASCVILMSGAKARTKSIRIEGDPALLTARLDDLVSATRAE